MSQPFLLLATFTNGDGGQHAKGEAAHMRHAQTHIMLMRTLGKRTRKAPTSAATAAEARRTPTLMQAVAGTICAWDLLNLQ